MARLTSSERPLRADAERNRLRILRAAKDVFAERGLDASLDDVAAHAGVGVGTVYRRFPSKDALIDALFETRIAAVADLAREALEHEDPWEGFVGYLTGVCELAAADRGFKEAMFNHEDARERVNRARETIEPLALQVVHRAQAAGRLRADIGPYDIPMMHMMVGGLAEVTRSADPDYWRRVLAVLLDGLVAERGEPGPLPAEPLGRDEFLDVMSGWRARSG